MRSALLLGLGLLLAACSSTTPPPKSVMSDAPPEPEKIDPGPTSMESEIGGLNEEAMDAAFASLDVTHCISQGSEKLEHLGGDFKMKLRIDRKGSARWVYLSSSTLGDRDTEKCLLDLARAKTWPKPLGGEGIAEKEYSIDPPTEAVAVDPKRETAPVNRVRQDTAKCRKGVDGSFMATVYVKADGVVDAAGLSVPSEKGEDVADCMIDAIRKVRFRSVVTKPQKVSFEIR
jgi:putative hemolysin